jgi:hypothetical protein
MNNVLLSTHFRMADHTLGIRGTSAHRALELSRWRGRTLRVDIVQVLCMTAEACRMSLLWYTIGVMRRAHTSAGNPWPDDNRSTRGGENLFTCSVVALDAITGKYRWHYRAFFTICGISICPLR